MPRRHSQRTSSPTEQQSPTFSSTIESYEMIRALGEGAYSHVRLSTHKETPCVIKCIPRNRVPEYVQEDGERVPSEVSILKRIPVHPNVVSLTHAFSDELFWYLVFPYASGMDMFDFIEGYDEVPMGIVRTLFGQVAAAVGHLHGNGVVHRDIKDENVIVTPSMHATLIDFGSAAVYGADTEFSANEFIGTPEFAPPEVVGGQKHRGPPVDVWGLGMLLYVLMYREAGVVEDGMVRVPYVRSAEATELLLGMLRMDPQERMSVEGVVSHSFLTNMTPNRE